MLVERLFIIEIWSEFLVFFMIVFKISCVFVLSIFLIEIGVFLVNI